MLELKAKMDAIERRTKDRKEVEAKMRENESENLVH